MGSSLSVCTAAFGVGESTMLLCRVLRAICSTSTAAEHWNTAKVNEDCQARVGGRAGGRSLAQHLTRTCLALGTLLLYLGIVHLSRVTHQLHSLVLLFLLQNKEPFSETQFSCSKLMSNVQHSAFLSTQVGAWLYIGRRRVGMSYPSVVKSDLRKPRKELCQCNPPNDPSVSTVQAFSMVVMD